MSNKFLNETERCKFESCSEKPFSEIEFPNFLLPIISIITKDILP